ncbi:NAD+ kinase [Entomoplasma freundtii]|uniref:NAD kinase n=1 Tax=Entomoplasma freundtii TaxID=74700 RepID=A0A2K8NSM9_9MOLU|nr:NAD(+)/NADH kinase [Entomoplasma freundtii]ATZ16566.1 inorganic polyphosphate/ATP-NAD kinase [Entomoplasma freundtii]TDY58268.1 NAD+ kinase [Entomoplasma freundtii]
MITYAIVTNDYPESIALKSQLKEMIKLNPSYLEVHTKPDYVFVIGGDGTFLNAVHLFENDLKTTTFIPMKFGGIGFYTNHNTTADLELILKSGLDQNHHYFEYSLLELLNGSKTHYSLNEIKIVNNIRPLELDVLINNEKLETFRGTGLVFATPSGSTGFAKSAGGPIIYPNIDIFEMLELFPVSTNKFRTLNAPMIFSKNQTLSIVLKKPPEVAVSIDTKDIKIEDPLIIVKLSQAKVKVMSLSSEEITKTKLLKSIFVLQDRTKN